MKLKHLAIAALAVSAMGSAMAQVTGSPSTSTLVLIAADSGSSYMFNTGISLSSLVAGTVSESFTLPNWSYSTEFTNGAYSATNTGGVEWGVFGGSFVSSTSATMMVGGASAPTGYNNSGLGSDAQTLSADLNTIPSGVVAGSGSANYANPTTFFPMGYNGGGQNQGLTDDNNNSSNVYYETLVPTGKIIKGNTLANVTTVGETVTFNAATGVLTFTGTAAAVPEPSRLALMLAGLGVIGFVARRRTSV